MNQIVIPQGRAPGIAGIAFFISGAVHRQAEIFPAGIFERMPQTVHPARLLPRFFFVFSFILY